MDRSSVSRSGDDHPSCYICNEIFAMKFKPHKRSSFTSQHVSHHWVILLFMELQNNDSFKKAKLKKNQNALKYYWQWNGKMKTNDKRFKFVTRSSRGVNQTYRCIFLRLNTGKVLEYNLVKVERKFN